MGKFPTSPMGRARWGVALLEALIGPFTGNKAYAGETDIPESRLGPLGRTAGDQPRGFASRGLGLRSSFSPGDAGGDSNFGWLAYERATGVFGSEVISARYFDELWIGGDSRDIAFQLDIEASVGPAFRIFDGFSMKLRPSVRAAHRQGLGLLQTELRFPGLEAGFGIEHDLIDLDWVFHVAPSLAGEWKALESSRDLAGSTIGTSLSWSLWTQIPVRFDLDFTRFVATKSQWEVEEDRHHLCLLFGETESLPTHRTGDPRRPRLIGPRARDYSVQFCVDLGVSRGTRRAEGLSLYSVGLSAILGQFSLLDSAPAL